MEAFGILGLMAFIQIRKTNKDLKRKRNSRRESQRRVMHQKNLLNHRGVI